MSSWGTLTKNKQPKRVSMHTRKHNKKNRFLQIAEEYDDAISLYSAGLVADVYLNNLSEAIEIYKKLTKMYPEHEQSIVAHDRMNEITSTIESELHKIEQEKFDMKRITLE